MKKSINRLSILMVVLLLTVCLLPSFAFAGTRYEPVQMRSDLYTYRNKIVTTYQGETTSHGSSSIIYQYQNRTSVTQTANFHNKYSTSYSLSIGLGAKKSDISAQMSGNIGGGEETGIDINTKLKPGQTITAYKRMDTKTKKWKHVITRQYKEIGTSTWINCSIPATSTTYSYEKNTYPHLWTTLK